MGGGSLPLCSLPRAWNAMCGCSCSVPFWLTMSPPSSPGIWLISCISYFTWHVVHDSCKQRDASLAVRGDSSSGRPRWLPLNDRAQPLAPYFLCRRSLGWDLSCSFVSISEHQLAGGCRWVNCVGIRRWGEVSPLVWRPYTLESCHLEHEQIKHSGKSKDTAF